MGQSVKLGRTLAAERHVVGDMSLRVHMGGAGPALVLLHGFTGGGDGWTGLAEQLTKSWRVIAPDLPGHGGSDVPEERTFSLDECASRLSALLDGLGIDEAVVAGYSLGGRTALTWAVTYPQRVRALVVESASPGIISDGERQTRRDEDDALARFIEVNGVEAFVDRWESVPLFASQRRLPAQVRRRIRDRRLSQSAEGLAASLRTMGAGVMRPLHGVLASLTMPVLLLAGELDEKYCRITGEMAGRMPKATMHVVPDAGHAVHVERPDAWLGHVTRFLRDV